MTREEIINKLRDIMQESTEKRVDWSTVSGETTIESLGFDSLSILDLIYDIQQEFDIQFDAEQLVSIQTVDQLAEFLSGKIA
jgi:acyl carrier protein